MEAGDDSAVECIGRLHPSFNFCMVQTMTISLQIVLLEPEALTRAQLALTLVRAGLGVVECADVSSLYEALDAYDASADTRSGAAPVFYVRRAAYSAAMLDGMLPHLRARYGVAVVVGLDDEGLGGLPGFAGADLCIDAARAADMLMTLDLATLRSTHACGADKTENIGAVERAQPASEPSDGIGYDMPIQTTEPNALAESDLQDALRGDYTTPEEAYGTWKIAHKGWVIINPRGEHIPLTGVERNFFEVLLGSERHEVSRDMLDAGQCGFALDSMSVLVSRLRKKIGASGCPLPLHTVHGLGYVFIGGLVRLRYTALEPVGASRRAAA